MPLVLVDPAENTKPHSFHPFHKQMKFEAFPRSFQNLTSRTEQIPKISPESSAKSAERKIEEDLCKLFYLFFGISEMTSCYVPGHILNNFNEKFGYNNVFVDQIFQHLPFYFISNISLDLFQKLNILFYFFYILFLTFEVSL